MENLKIDKKRKIEFSSVVSYSSNDELYYDLRCNTEGANLSELGLLLASLHVIENRIIQHIEDIEPIVNIEE